MYRAAQLKKYALSYGDSAVAPPSPAHLGALEALWRGDAAECQKRCVDSIDRLWSQGDLKSTRLSVDLVFWYRCLFEAYADGDQFSEILQWNAHLGRILSAWPDDPTPWAALIALGYELSGQPEPLALWCRELSRMPMAGPACSELALRLSWSGHPSFHWPTVALAPPSAEDPVSGWFFALQMAARWAYRLEAAMSFDAFRHAFSASFAGYHFVERCQIQRALDTSAPLGGAAELISRVLARPIEVEEPPGPQAAPLPRPPATWFVVLSPVAAAELVTAAPGTTSRVRLSPRARPGDVALLSRRCPLSSSTRFLAVARVSHCADSAKVWGHPLELVYVASRAIPIAVDFSALKDRRAKRRLADPNRPGCYQLSQLAAGEMKKMLLSGLDNPADSLVDHLHAVGI